MRRAIDLVAGLCCLGCALLLTGSGASQARDYGQMGQTFPVIETDLLATIESRLRRAEASGELDRVNAMFAKKVEAGGVVEAKLETVGEACRTFGETRLEAEGRFKRCVCGDPVTKVRRDKLHEPHLIGWRSRLEVRPAHRGTAVLRAALSKVVAPGTPQVRSCIAGSLAVYSAPSCSRSVIDGRAMAA